MAAIIGAVMLVTVAQADGVIDDGVVQTVQVANEAGVPVDKLMGAMSSTGLGPREYLIGVGELDASPPPTSPAPVPAIRGVWLILAQCESSGIWSRNSGNGYYGGLQEDMSFWRRYGGLAYAPRPDLASEAAQVAVAERGLAVQGFGAWPACSRRLGLR